MELPFTTAQFFDVMGQYNQAVWPMQFGLTLLALIAVGLLVWRRGYSDRAIAAILGLLWLWTGIAYQLLFFTTINQAAFVFTAIYLAGAAAFFWAGVARGRMRFSATAPLRRAAGLVLLTYALLVYPALSALLGHAYPMTPTFGLPCPTTIFSIGMLCFLATPYPRYPLLAPIAWSAIGSQAAFLFGIYQDLGLLLAGVIGVLLMWRAK